MTWPPRAAEQPRQGAATEPAHFERDDDDSDLGPNGGPPGAATEPAHFERDDECTACPSLGPPACRNGARSF